MDGLKRVVAIALLILGGYYLLVAAMVFPSLVTFGNYTPSFRILALIAIIIIVVGLLIDDKWRTKIKNTFS